MRKTVAVLIAAQLLGLTAVAHAEVAALNIPKGAGGLGFLPLLVMERHGLVESMPAPQA